MSNKFLSNKKGNFASMLAIASVPLLAGIAMTLEYSNLSTNQMKLQSAVDAAVLFAGKYYLDNDSLPTKQAVTDFVASNFDGNLTNVDLQVDGTNLVAIADSKADAFFFGKVYPSVFDQEAEATVPYNTKSYTEIVMVLDTTRSMREDGKLATLKTVAKAFIDELNKESNARTVFKVGIVPFSNHVNVGTSNRNASWIDVPADKTETKEVCTNSWPSGVDMTCVDEIRYTDGTPYTANVCTPTDPSVQQIQTCSMQTVTTKWYGCVGSRKDPYMITDGAYATRMPGVISTGNWHCPSPLTPVTDKITTLKAGIDALVDRGDTYMAPGVMWGLRLLSNKAPFSESVNFGTLPANTTHKKIMIVMTDGDNSRSANQPWGASNWGSDLVKANDLTKGACTAAKNENVTVYTIAFGTTISADGKAVMQDCAGKAERYFPAANASALSDAFKAITSSILSLRLSS